MSTSSASQHEIDTLRLTLEREKNLRKVEHLKATQTETRLRRQLKLLLEETEQQRQDMEDMRARNEDDLEEMLKERNDVLAVLREAETRAQALEEELALENGVNREGSAEVWRRKFELEQNKVMGLEVEVEGLKSELGKVHNEVLAAARESSSSHRERSLEESPLKKARLSLENAPPAVLSELNKTRQAYSNAQRRERIHGRKIEALEGQLRGMAPLKEQLSSVSLKYKQLENEVTKLRRERDAGVVLEKQWEAWRQGMKDVVPVVSPNKSSNKCSSATGPPEVATVLRYLRAIRNEKDDAEREKREAQAQAKAQKERLTAIQSQLQEVTVTCNDNKRHKDAAEEKLKSASLQNKTLSAQLDISKRECTSLRSLIRTYDEGQQQQQNSSSFSSNTGTAAAATVEGLTVSLNAAKEDATVMKNARDKLTQQMEVLLQEKEKMGKEHERVLEKFGKLRDALMAEREKAAAAEDRACRAETLAGKGSFNTETSRVLHLSQNPFTEALKSKYETQINNLKLALSSQQAAAAILEKGGVIKTPPPSQTSIDAQKLHTRLKENFKQQIGLFREGVYLLTGFKIDMFSDTDRPRFKVRSMYAENEDDYLMFVWPQDISQSSPPKEEDVIITSLDLLDSDFARSVSRTDCFAYMTKFKSIPSFMAALTLNLFEKQTVVL